MKVPKKQKRPDKANSFAPPSQSARNPIADAVAPFNAMVISASQTQHIQQGGLIPSPAAVREWEALLPGAADRLLRIVESETSHRRDTEMAAIEIQGRDQIAYRRVEMAGQCFGLIIGLVALAGSVYAGTHGAQITGAAIGVGGITGLVTAFILGRNQLNKQRKDDFERQSALIEKQQQTAAELKNAPLRPSLPPTT